MPRSYPRPCNYCGKEFSPDIHDPGKFCSRSCASKSRKGIPQKKRTKRIIRVCAYCSKEFQRIISDPESKTGFYFCSRTCKDLGQRVESNLPGLRPKHYKDGSNYYKEIAFRTYPKKCNRCGYDKIIDILQVHHKDRNHKNKTPENLEIVCPNCHEEEHFLAGDGRYKRKNGVGGENRTPV